MYKDRIHTDKFVQNSRTFQGLQKDFHMVYKFMKNTDLQGKFNFQGLFKKALHIQVLFKPVGTLIDIGLPVIVNQFFKNFPRKLCFCLFVLLLYVPSQQLWSWRDG